jgi:hypothetical protein
MGNRPFLRGERDALLTAGGTPALLLILGRMPKDTPFAYADCRFLRALRYHQG